MIELADLNNLARRVPWLLSPLGGNRRPAPPRWTVLLALAVCIPDKGSWQASARSYIYTKRRLALVLVRRSASIHDPSSRIDKRDLRTPAEIANCLPVTRWYDLMDSCSGGRLRDKIHALSGVYNSIGARSYRVPGRSDDEAELAHTGQYVRTPSWDARGRPANQHIYRFI